MKRKAVFLDKDGTLIEDLPYNADPAMIRLAPFAGKALSVLKTAGFKLYVITNQPGIAYGLFSAEDVRKVKLEIERLLMEMGVTLDGFYFCPHHPAGSVVPLAIECRCRKPMPGLILEAAKEHDLDLANSWFIGDILNDVEAGHRAGCKSILIDCGHETDWDLSDLRRPDFRAPDLLVAARHVLDNSLS